MPHVSPYWTAPSTLARYPEHLTQSLRSHKRELIQLKDIKIINQLVKGNANLFCHNSMLALPLHYLHFWSVGVQPFYYKTGQYKSHETDAPDQLSRHRCMPFQAVLGLHAV